MYASNGIIGLNQSLVRVFKHWESKLLPRAIDIGIQIALSLWHCLSQLAVTFSRSLTQNAFLAKDQPEGCKNPHSVLGASMDRRRVDADSSVITKNWPSVVLHGVRLEEPKPVVRDNLLID